MRWLVGCVKMWLLVSLAAGIAVAIQLQAAPDSWSVVWQGQARHDITITVLLALAAGALVFVAGLLVTGLIALLGLIVPLALVIAFAAALLGLVAELAAVLAVAVGGALASAASMLIVLCGCVLLVRAFGRVRRPAGRPF